jgi:acyl-CoA dehydrogenase
MAPSAFMPMSWRTPDIEEHRAQVRRFVATEVAPHQQRWAKQQHVDRELWNKAGALGMLASDVPSEYGGSDGSVAHQTVMIEELTAVGDTAFSISVHAIVQQYSASRARTIRGAATCRGSRRARWSARSR